MPTFDTFPDVEAIAARRLRDAGITNLGTRVYSSIPGDPTYPLIVLRRLGGEPAVRTSLDAGRLEIQVWGESKSQAHDIAATARVKLLELEGEIISVPVGAFVTAVNDDQGLTWDPDNLTGYDRYVFAMRIFAKSH